MKGSAESEGCRPLWKSSGSMPSFPRPSPGTTEYLRHGFAVVLLDTVVILLLAAALPGFAISSPWAGLATAVVLGLLNAIVWPVIVRLTLPLAIVSLGFASLALNALVVGLVLVELPWVRIDGLAEGAAVAILLSVVTTIIAPILAFEQDSDWYLRTVRREVRKMGLENREAGTGFLFLEIDGLAHDILRRALASGNAPNISRLVREGSHRLRRWETDWSSQTGACQAGILHGNNRDMPAFRWWEKDESRAIVTNHPRDAAEIERRHSDGRGLLSNDGASRANILSGDARHCQLTMSTILDRRDRLGRDYAAYFSRPFAVIGTAFSAVVELTSERISAIRARRSGIQPSIHRGLSYSVMRAWATVVQLDLQIAAVISDLMAGRPAIYTTFLAYDEVAHHSGIERPETMTALRKVDRAIGRLIRVAERAPRPYEIVILSDHGQSQGETFLDRYGLSLEDLVRELTGDAEIAELEEQDEARAYLRASVTEASTEDSATGRTIKVATRNRFPSEERAIESSTVGRSDLPEVVVMASGNLGLISFPRLPERASLEWLEERYPRLVDGLAGHPGIGFLLVESESDGAVVIGGSGKRLLERDRIEGEDPLLAFGPRAGEHVLRTHRFKTCPDIVVNSTYWAELDEVAAFEELVGSHGGLGGTQSFPFILHPSTLPWVGEDVVGAERIHAILTGWMDLDRPASASRFQE